MTQVETPTFRTTLSGVVVTPKMLERIGRQLIWQDPDFGIKFDMYSPIKFGMLSSKGIELIGESAYVFNQLSDLIVEKFPDETSLSDGLESIRNNSTVIGFDDTLTFEMLNADGLKAVAATAKVDAYPTEIRNERLGDAITQSTRLAFMVWNHHNEEFHRDSIRAKQVLPDLLAEASRRTGIKWSGELSESAVDELKAAGIFEALVDPKRPRGPVELSTKPVRAPRHTSSEKPSYGELSLSPEIDVPTELDTPKDSLQPVFMEPDLGPSF